MDALSLACNVMTVIDFGRTLFEVSQQAYQAGVSDPGIQATAVDLSKATKTLENSIATGIQQPGTQQPIDHEEKELLQIARRCRVTAEQLVKEYEKLAVPAQSSRYRRTMKALRVGLKRLWRHRQLDELDREMRGFQEAMQTRILVHLQ